MGLKATENKPKVVDGRIKIQWKRVGLKGGVIAESLSPKKSERLNSVTTVLDN